MDDSAEGRFFHALLKIGGNYMLKEYAWRDSTWQFEESEAPDGAIELTATTEEPELEPEPEPEPEPVTEIEADLDAEAEVETVAEPEPEPDAKAKKPANKSRSPRNKAQGND